LAGVNRCGPRAHFVSPVRVGSCNVVRASWLQNCDARRMQVAARRQRVEAKEAQRGAELRREAALREAFAEKPRTLIEKQVVETIENRAESKALRELLAVVSSKAPRLIEPTTCKCAASSNGRRARASSRSSPCGLAPAACSSISVAGEGARLPVDRAVVFQQLAGALRPWGGPGGGRRVIREGSLGKGPGRGSGHGYASSTGRSDICRWRKC
jgi:hypothetical protein